MDPIEKAIRTAFEKGNPDDKAFRDKVYRSAFAALDRALQANPSLTVETAINRRRNLQAKIDSIESEHTPAVAADEVQTPPVAPAVRDSGPAPSPFVEPVAIVARDTFAKAPPVHIEPLPAPSQRAAPDPIVVPSPRQQAPSLAGEPSAALGGVTREHGGARVRAKQRRRPFAVMFILVTVLTACAIGGWWAYSVGLFKAPDSWMTWSNPPLTIEEEDFDPPVEGAAPALKEDGTEAPRNWITVFSPSDPATVSAPSGAAVEVLQDESGAFLRMRSGSTGAAVIFDVGQGVLDKIIGKKAVFDIVARAEEGSATQISISCDFGELGDCGRKRYAVGYERGEYLFDVDLPQKDPGASGSIAINSDFENKGRAVDIYEIRVSVSE